MTSSCSVLGEGEKCFSRSVHNFMTFSSLFLFPTQVGVAIYQQKKTTQTRHAFKTLLLQLSPQSLAFSITQLYFRSGTDTLGILCSFFWFVFFSEWLKNPPAILCVCVIYQGVEMQTPPLHTPLQKKDAIAILGSTPSRLIVLQALVSVHGYSSGNAGGWSVGDEIAVKRAVSSVRNLRNVF